MGFDGDERRRCYLDGKTCPHAEDAADNAVRKVFAILGVDIDKPESVAEFQESLRFGRKLMKGADHGILALIGLVMVGAGAALWAGIVSKVTGH
jgi:hypothetical protein